MTHTRTWRLGLTGGIGSGKSTVASMLERLGASVIDADAISRSTTQPGGAAMGEIEQTFGPRFVAPDGALDRDAMRQLVFEQPEARRQLEAIIHPRVAEETERQFQSAVRGGAPCVVFDIPLLVESGRWRERVDGVLVIDCSEETQIARVQARNGWPRAQILAVIQAQATRAQRQAAADWLILNEGLGLDAFAAAVTQLARQWGLPTPGRDLA